MRNAGGYVLLVPKSRREELLRFSQDRDSIGEPVPKFSHSSKSPLLVFLSFREKKITHIASGRKGLAAGSGLVRLNLSEIYELSIPVPIKALKDDLTGRAAAHIEKRLEGGGLFPPLSFQDFLATFAKLSPECTDRLERFGQKRRARVSQFTERQRYALAQQKEGVGLAMTIAKIDPRTLLDWQPPIDGQATSFLDGLPQARLREDAMVVHDLDHVPGFDIASTNQVGVRVFESEASRLTVILANKLPLEEQLGADLIYYNEIHKSFVMVQYKAMEIEGQGRSVFRLPNEQLEKEIDRMEAIQRQLLSIHVSATVDEYRLDSNPFFMKLCRRHTFNPDDGGLFPGMYLPIHYWTRLVKDDRTLGKRGGRLVTYDNVGRKVSEDMFVNLVTSGWLGTTPSQSHVIRDLIREVLMLGKAVVFAVHEEPVSNQTDATEGKDVSPEGNVEQAIVKIADLLDGTNRSGEKPAQEPTTKKKADRKQK